MAGVMPESNSLRTVLAFCSQVIPDFGSLKYSSGV